LASFRGQLVVGFEHPLDACVLRVWVEEVLVLEATVRTPQKDFWTPVPLGEHEVRVEVIWKDGRATRSVSGSFVEDVKPRLAVQLRRENLLLSWE